MTPGEVWARLQQDILTIRLEQKITPRFAFVSPANFSALIGYLNLGSCMDPWLFFSQVGPCSSFGVKVYPSKYILGDELLYASGEVPPPEVLGQGEVLALPPSKSPADPTRTLSLLPPPKKRKKPKPKKKSPPPSD